MEFRQASERDVPQIMDIIKQAQRYFKEQGIDQWQGDYPNEETIQKDIAHQHGYVLVKDNHLVATVAVSFDGEKNYETIYNGTWLSNQPYAVIHRLAIDNDMKGKGLSSVMLAHIVEMCRQKGINSIKVDTHEENASMQKLLEKNQFHYCGIIHVSDGSERVAFEKLV